MHTFKISKLTLLVVFALTAATLCSCGVRPIDPTATATESDQPTSAQIVRISEETAEGTVMPEPEQNAPLTVTEADRHSIMDEYRLPDLARMDEADSKEYVQSLKSIQRVSNLGVDTTQLAYPEYNYKVLFNKVFNELLPAEKETAAFAGASASELNAFISANAGSEIVVTSSSISVDEPISIPSDTTLSANGCQLVNAGSDRAMNIRDTQGTVVKGFVIEDASFDYGVFVKDSSNFVIENVTISNTRIKALPVMDDSHDFAIRDCVMKDNECGGIALCKDVHDGIIEGNEITGSKGWKNQESALFMGSPNVADENGAELWFGGDFSLETRLQAPHDIVIIKNELSDNIAQGIYSHGSWRCYIIDNSISGNHKEGTCLDFGTLATYVSANKYVNNGHREGVDDGEPETNKLPGLSMDNGCYNTIRGNVFSYNGGTGIKAVRASSRNIIIDNAVENNNRGMSEAAHFFGIELASDMKPDYEGAAGLDFAACYENIVARNTVTGSHYACLYLGEEDYANDAFNNVFMGATEFSIECHSEKFNSLVDNVIDAPEFYCGRIIPS